MRRVTVNVVEMRPVITAENSKRATATRNICSTSMRRQWARSELRPETPSVGSLRLIRYDRPRPGRVATRTSTETHSRPDTGEVRQTGESAGE